MSYEDYQMMSTENEGFKQQYENLAQEKMVYLTLVDTRATPLNTHKMSGVMIEKDELLNKMQKHLDAVEERSVNRELEYQKRIERLKEELHRVKAEANSTKWWHKLLK